MANLGGGFDASKVDPSSGFPTIPPGDYDVQIVASEMKDTKPQNGKPAGKYLALTMEILNDGDYKGKKLFENLNLHNANQTTVEIAQRTLSAICHATGVMNLEDSEELHFIPMVASVTVQVDSRDKDAPPGVEKRLQNSIKKYAGGNPNLGGNTGPRPGAGRGPGGGSGGAAQRPAGGGSNPGGGSGGAGGGAAAAPRGLPWKNRGGSGGAAAPVQGGAEGSAGATGEAKEG